MRRVRPILAMSLPRDVNRIALLASPFLSLQLSIGLLDFGLIYDDHMVRDSMGLVARLWPVFNISVSHIPTFSVSLAANRCVANTSMTC